MARARRGIRTLQIALGAVPVIWLFSRGFGCAGRDAEIARTLNDAALLDTFVANDGHGDAPADAPPDTLDDAPQDAPLSPVLLGVNPGITTSDGSSVELNLAEIQALGAGSRAGSFVVPFDALIDDSGAAIPSAVSELTATCQRYAQHGARVALDLAIVDRTRDARPGALKLDWTSSATLGAVDTLIDQAFAACGGVLADLAVGNDADRYLGRAGAADRTGFVALATHAFDYARAHADRPPGLGLAVGFSLAALSSAGTSEQAQLLAAGDVVWASVLALDGSFRAEDPASIVAKLGSLTVKLELEASAKPLLLAGVAYPSASEAGSSPEMQRAFYDALFQFLSAKRDRIPLLTIDGLFDRTSASCSAESALYGAPDDPVLVPALCSLGLEGRADGDAGADPGFAAKPAESRVFTALASFGSP